MKKQITSTYDQELAEKGMMRTYVLETFVNPDGSTGRVSREKIVKIPKSKAANLIAPKKTKAPAKKVVKGAPTKQQRTVDLVRTKMNSSTKQDLIDMLMTELIMTKAGATTYYYNAMKAIAGK
jgi:hypothetical protein